MWRYGELLPVTDERNIVSLGETQSPVLLLEKLGGSFGLKALYVKDDGVMPTGSFKARGQSSAVSKCKELGLGKVALASAGNAGGALAAYAARGGLEAYVFVPKDAPSMNVKECLLLGAKVFMVDGLINDAGRIVSACCTKYGWFNLSTLREPYRVEGKKTMGFEIAEQFHWDLPDVIIYPTGGGTGLLGIWKAFEELEELGWISDARPRLVAVQSETCAPVVKAFKEGKESVELFRDAYTVAPGLRVPFPYASEQILKVLRSSKGTAVSVRDSEMLDAVKRFGREGLYVCPEGGATLAGLKVLLDDGWVDKDEKILLYNTGSALKYGELLESQSLPVIPKDAEVTDINLS